MVLDPSAMEDKKVPDRAVIVHGTARQDISKTAAGSGEEYADPGKAGRLLQVIDRYLDCGDFRNGFVISKNTGNFLHKLSTSMKIRGFKS